jgi:hypothetical protein
MYPTMEMRWFWPDRLPPAVHQWFDHQMPAPTAEREDWYLCLPDTVDLGVKVREGKLEIKKRLLDRGLCTVGDRLEGHLELWVKWGFESSSTINFSNPAGVWLAVQKSRQQQTYILTNTDQIERLDAATDASTSVTQGCNLEWVELSALDQPWVSVCFEAFGNEASVEQTLKRTVSYLLEQASFPSLTGENSCSYPQWLKQLVKQKQ